MNKHDINIFDLLSGYIDPDKSFAENKAHVEKSMEDGTLSRDLAAELLVSASIMPALAATNLQQADEIEALKKRLDEVKKMLDEASGKSESPSNVLTLDGKLVN